MIRSINFFNLAGSSYSDALMHDVIIEKPIKLIVGSTKELNDMQRKQALRLLRFQEDIENYFLSLIFDEKTSYVIAYDVCKQRFDNAINEMSSIKKLKHLVVNENYFIDTYKPVEK